MADRKDTSHLFGGIKVKIKKKKHGLKIITYSFSKYLKRFKIDIRLDVGLIVSKYFRLDAYFERTHYSCVGFDNFSCIYFHILSACISFTVS